MLEWIPIFMGLCLGILWARISHGSTHRLSVFNGVLLIALAVVLLGGEWRSNPLYFVLDLIEAFSGFVAGKFSMVRTHVASSSLDRKTTSPQ